MKRPIAIFLMLATLLVMALPAHAAAKPESKSGQLAIRELTERELVAAYETIIKPTTRFSDRPQTTNPYSIGDLTEEYRQAALQYLNFMRLEARMPSLEMTAEKNKEAQAAAALLAANNEPSNHCPRQPNGMDNSLYTLGARAAEDANLCDYLWPFSLTAEKIDEVRTQNAFRSDVNAWMNDVSDDNSLRVGHRRWFLNPDLKYVGIGEADAPSMDRVFSAVTIRDASGTAQDYSFVSWPASGNMLTETFTVDAAWSVSLNPTKYQKPDMSTVTVTLTRVSDRKSWTFNNKTNHIPNGAEQFVLVENSGRGIPNSIIFRPDYSGFGEMYDGDWTVRITGLKYVDGSAAELSYRTHFFTYQSYCTHEWGHTRYESETSCEQYHICNICGKKENLGVNHSWIQTRKTEATCTENGVEILVCRHCNDATAIITPALGHNWKVTEVLNEQGSEGHVLALYTCQNCGEERTADYCASEIFTDVPEAGNWAHAGIDYAFINGMFNGSSATTFEPETTMNRAMLVTVLYRMDGSPETDAQNVFTDVPAGRWYTDAVTWANEAGITHGTTTTTFEPDGKLTREQLATFLSRYAAYKGLPNQPTEDLSFNYTDRNAISRFARKPMAWAVESGIINGTSNTTLSPQGSATRAQVATMLMRYARWADTNKEEN